MRDQDDSLLSQGVPDHQISRALNQLYFGVYRRPVTGTPGPPIKTRSEPTKRTYSGIHFANFHLRLNTRLHHGRRARSFSRFTSASRIAARLRSMTIEALRASI
jgi:hypothetical protein